LVAIEMSTVCFHAASSIRPVPVEHEECSGRQGFERVDDRLEGRHDGSRAGRPASPSNWASTAGLVTPNAVSVRPARLPGMRRSPTKRCATVTPCPCASAIAPSIARRTSGLIAGCARPVVAAGRPSSGSGPRAARTSDGSASRLTGWMNAGRPGVSAAHGVPR
jgi:hypothetical protein